MRQHKKVWAQTQGILQNNNTSKPAGNQELGRNNRLIGPVFVEAKACASPAMGRLSVALSEQVEQIKEAARLALAVSKPMWTLVFGQMSGGHPLKSGRFVGQISPFLPFTLLP